MFKTGRAVLAGMALAAVTAAQASATPWLGNGPYCGGNTFSTCFSVDLSWTVNSGTSVTVVLKLTNTDATAGLKWFSVGIDNLAADVAYTLGAVPAGWQAPPPNDFSGGPFLPSTASAVIPGGEAPGFAQRSWTFNFTGTSRTSAQWDALLQAAGTGLHAGGVTINGNSCSTKVIVRDNLAAGSAYGTNGPDGSRPECESVVPEPITMSLVAFGLVALGGAGLIRRRRSL